jgi:hypothetical protein
MPIKIKLKAHIKLVCKKS